MLLKFCYLYQKSPKRLKELRRVVEAWEESFTKPTKACGSRWINHKCNAMEIFLESYGAFTTHVESLSQTDFSWESGAELKEYLKQRKDASVPIYTAMYLDILSPFHKLSLGFQQDLHNPVKAIRQIQEFVWTMAKVQVFIEMDLDSTENRLTSYKGITQNVV